MNFEGKKVLVAGAGKSGISASKLLLEKGASVLLFDENAKDAQVIYDKVGTSENIDTMLGNLDESRLSDVSLMVISPGIPVDAPFADVVRSHDIPVWSEIELAFQAGKGTIAAITGTNGKTTTTSLVGEILKAYNENTYVVGNIGIPYTDVAAMTTDDSFIVAEVSSFQLETIVDFTPKVSAVLNVTPDHLNRHYTMENYANEKAKVFKNQDANGYVVLNYDDEITKKMAEKSKANVVYFSRTTDLEEGIVIDDNQDIYIKTKTDKIYVMNRKEIRLMGAHNTENAMAGIGIAYYMGVPVEVIAEACRKFKAVEHRIEYVKTVKGVDYYNDSKGTNPDAAIKGIQAMDRKTVLIGGGYDKKVSFDEWILAFDGKVKKLVLLGQTAEEIAETAKKYGFTDICFAESLKEAVLISYQVAEDGDAVLLSPACASWGMFDNYEQRGNMFKDYVLELGE